MADSRETLITGSARPRIGPEFGPLKSSTIVMIDDEPTTLEVLEALLEEEGYRNIRTTTDSTQALSLIEAENPDVILLDLVMPEVDGFEILDALRAGEAHAYTPVIILTSATDPETKLGALERGATDFLAKPVDGSELALRLRNTLAAKAFQDRLARYDALTGLPNRRFFMERLARTLDRARANSTPCAVLHIDLDRFQQINDALGPSIGDEALKTVAKRLDACVRPDDLLGIPALKDEGEPLSRFGGDEFSLFLPNVGSPGLAARVAQRIQSILAEPMVVGGRQLFLTASIGIAFFPDDGDDIETLVQSAESALAQTQTASVNSYSFYSRSLNSESVARLALENDLRLALERNQLSLHYQPKLDLRTGRVVGAEALMRWKHPQLGAVPPLQFIPLAEECGIIGSLGSWAIGETVRQIRAWQIADFGPIRVSVNVSPLQFSAGFPGLVRAALQETGIDPGLLILEVTEGMLMENPSHAERLLFELKEQGLRTSLDDFGTGYSSLERLKHIPLDELKIDRSFIKGTPGDPDDVAIVTAIISMAHTLGLTVVAEGVETPEQMALLQDCGCEEYQGFHCSPAVPASHWPSKIDAWSRVGAAS